MKWCPPLTFGPMVRRLRQDCWASLSELSAATGISVHWLGDIEQGLNQTTKREMRSLLAVARIWGAPKRDLARMERAWLNDRQSVGVRAQCQGMAS